MSIAVVWQSGVASLLIDKTEVNLKIMEDEIYQHNMMQVLQETANLLIINNETWPGQTVNMTLHNYTKNWKEHFSLIKSNLNRECLVLEDYTGLGQFNNYSVISTRSILAKEGQMYISTSYVNKLMPNRPGKFLNQLETVILKYNSTDLKFGEVKTIDIERGNTNQKIDLTDFEIFCFHNQYVHIFSGSLHLCLKKIISGTAIYYQIILVRPELKFEIVIGTYKEDIIKKINPEDAAPLDGLWRTKAIQMKLFSAGGGYLEGFVFGVLLDSVYVFSINKYQVFNVRFETFPYKIFDINYIASTLVIFSVKSQKKSVNQKDVEVQKIYYLERYPGAKLNVTNTVLMGEFTFLKGFTSNEGTEIIIETYKPQEITDYKLFVVIYGVYSFNLLTKVSSQTQTFVLWGNSHNQWSRGDLFKFDSFWLRESVMFLASTKFTGYYLTKRNGWTTRTDRNGYWVVRDMFKGFGASVYLDDKYNLYNTGYLQDLRLNQYLFMPFMSDLHDDNGLNKKCSVLKQRIGEYILEIRNTLPSESFYPYLRLTFTPKQMNVVTNILNIEFIRKETRLPYRIWRANNNSESTITVSKQRLTMPLKDIARGSYIVQRLDHIKMSSLDYTVQKEQVLLDIEENSMFRLYHIWHEIVNLRLFSLIEEMIGFEIVINDDPPVMLILYGTASSTNVTLFEIDKDTSKLKFDRFFIMSATINKVIPLIDNNFILFLEDGNIELFNGTSRSGIVLPYPGVNCRDIERLYHSSLKPSIICLNANRQYSVYYIDELVSKSLSYSLVQTECKDYGYLTQHSRLMTSETYSSYFFVYTPKDSNKKAKLSIFHVDVIERTEIFKIRDIELDELNIMLAGTYLVQGVYMIRDRVVIHFHQGLDRNCFIFATFNDDMEFVFMKRACVDKKLMIYKHEMLYPFKRHISSLIYENADPLLAVVVYDSTKRDEKNVLIIDPFAPTLETFPVLILPRHTRTEYLMTFPIYSCGTDNIRKSTIGMLHYRSLISSSIGEDEQIRFLFQIVDPGIPSIMFKQDSSVTYTHTNILTSKQDSLSTSLTINLQDHLELDDVNEHTAFDVKVNLKVISAEIYNEDSRTLYPSLNIDRQKQIKKFFTKNEATVLKQRYTSIIKRTVVDWEFFDESIFDTVLDTIKFTRPLNISWTREGINWKTLTHYDYFCFKFKRVLDHQECVKYGMVFYFEKSISVMYSSNITDASEKTALRIWLENDDCIEYFSINYKLYSICNIEYRQYVIAIDMETLSKGYDEQHNFPNMNSKFTEVSKFSVNDISFVRLTHRIRDLRHRRSVGGSNFVKFDEQGQGSGNFNRQSLGLKLVSTIYGLFTDYLTVVHKLTNKNYSAYLIHEVSMAAGNQLVIYIRVENIKLVYFDNSKEIETFPPPGSNMQFTVSGNKEIKETALSNGNVRVLAYSASDYTYDDKILFINLTAKSLNYNGTGAPINMTLFLNLPNYHSYLIRMHNEFTRCNSIIFRLFNPFSGLDNQYFQNKPQCMNWACVVISKPDGNLYYLMVYDMEEERLKTVPNMTNFKEIFKDDTSDCNLTQNESIAYNLDEIGDKYTLYPLQILGIENVQLISFDKSYKRESDPEELALLVFYRNTSYSQVLVNRNLRVTMHNLYISSNYIKMKIARLQGVNQWINVNVLTFAEFDYYKYYLFIGFCLFAAMVYCICTLRTLAKNEQMRVKDVDFELSLKSSGQLAGIDEVNDPEKLQDVMNVNNHKNQDESQESEDFMD